MVLGPSTKRGAIENSSFKRVPNISEEWVSFSASCTGVHEAERRRMGKVSFWFHVWAEIYAKNFLSQIAEERAQA